MCSIGFWTRGPSRCRPNLCTSDRSVDCDDPGAFLELEACGLCLELRQRLSISQPAGRRCCAGYGRTRRLSMRPVPPVMTDICCPRVSARPSAVRSRAPRDVHRRGRRLREIRAIPRPAPVMSQTFLFITTSPSCWARHFRTAQRVWQLATVDADRTRTRRIELMSLASGCRAVRRSRTGTRARESGQQRQRRALGATSPARSPVPLRQPM